MPVATLASGIISLSVCLLLSSLAYYKHVLTKAGTTAAFFVGLVIGILGDITWLVLLLFFLISSFAATRYRFALKEAMGVQEGRKGERGAMNVLANGVAPMTAAVLSSLATPLIPVEWAGIVFLSALAVAGADTLASEIGVLSDKARLITTFKPVKAGTDGGISALGEVCAIAASLYIALFGWVVLYLISGQIGMNVTLPRESRLIFIPLAIGFIGCQIDSVLGATLETKGYLHKKGVNLVSTCIGALMAYSLLLWLA